MGLSFNNIVLARRLTALVTTVFALVMYFLTYTPEVAYWDCPEYLTTASSLQVGHPPGNPFWTLAMRFVTLPFPPEYHSQCVNLCSMMLMAGAAGLLSLIIFRLCQHFFFGRVWRCVIAAAGGGMMFAVLDSVWFSALETEVYAFSTFLTAFTVWLTLKTTVTLDHARRRRLLILLAYVMGLSIGVHQLNLLIIPVLALIYLYNRFPNGGQTWHAWVAILLSFVVVALILAGLMPGAVAWAADMELFAVNSLHLPYFSGVTAYPLIALGVFISAIILLPRSPRWVAALILSATLWISGLLTISGSILLGLLLSLAAGLAAVYPLRISRISLLTGVWMVALAWVGYSCIALILIRGYAAPPINEAAPSDIFALQSYIARDQYGSKPLLYGATPYSRPMFEERWIAGDSIPDYSRYVLIQGKPKIVPFMPGARLNPRSGMLSHDDSVANAEVLKRGHGYILADYRFSRMTTPELDMWFPRITSSSPAMIKAYADWAGMTRGNMESVAISTAIDSLGNPTTKLLPNGEREKATALRPSYLQNMRYFLTYQVGYMYFRYLMWNFVGRQNDIASTGEIDHGNFVTGIRFIDKAMVGDPDLLPFTANSLRNGSHEYYALPLLLGIAGIVFLFRLGRKGRRALAVITLFFLMTGLAIVVYLNQTPCEPRERDYSFIGSYMAFCIWIGFGLAGMNHLFELIMERLTRRSLKQFAGEYSEWAGNLITGGLTLILLMIMALPNMYANMRKGERETSLFAKVMLHDLPATRSDDIIFSYGDNFTFPLWSEQQMSGTGADKTVLDISYLTTPEYMVNIMKQGERGVKTTATPADIAYGAYAFTRIAPDADTVPVKLIDALRDLYSRKSGAPLLTHSKVTIPGRTMADTITLDLRELAGSNGLIDFRQLMILDIIATNLEQENPRALAFMSHLPKAISLPVRDALWVEPFADVYAPHLSPEDRVGRSLKPIEIQTSLTAGLDDGHRIDHLTADQIRRQRGAAVRVAKRAFMEGDPVRAWRIIDDAYSMMSPRKVITGSFTVADSTFHEGEECARLLLDIFILYNDIGASGDTIPSYEDFLALLDRQKSLKKIPDMHKILPLASVIVNWELGEAGLWKEYYESLPPHRRATLSNENRRKIASIERLEKLNREIVRQMTIESIKHEHLMPSIREIPR